jgi:hypothetical protein
MEDSRIIVADNIDHFIVVDLIVDSNQTHWIVNTVPFFLGNF